jgi:hypothetical protein
MLAKELKVGQRFTIQTTVPESAVRVCLEPLEVGLGTMIRWGWPGSSFWCYMGMDCPVTLVSDES